MTLYLAAHAGILLALVALTRNVTKGQHRIMATVQDLKADIAALQAAVSTIPPILQASGDLNVKVIATLEDFSARLAALGTDPAAIDDLRGQINGMLAELRSDANAIAEQNVAMKAELDKVTAPPAPPPVVPPAA